MADFDNGIPPDETYINDSKISNISIETKNAMDADNDKIFSVSLSTVENVESIENKLVAVSMEKGEPTYNNWGGFL